VAERVQAKLAGQISRAVRAAVIGKDNVVNDFGGNLFDRLAQSPHSVVCRENDGDLSSI
jgi:hypothetical protein